MSDEQIGYRSFWYRAVAEEPPQSQRILCAWGDDDDQEMKETVREVQRRLPPASKALMIAASLS